MIGMYLKAMVAIWVSVWRVSLVLVREILMNMGIARGPSVGGRVANEGFEVTIG